tara:strand:- start:194 stop:628 length:435 start_codon:yes stop_codon:yes gene_type:complete
MTSDYWDESRGKWAETSFPETIEQAREQLGFEPNGDSLREGHWFNVSSIRKANKEAGYFFFSKATMEFFKSRVLPTVYAGRLFITSDDSPEGRIYKVRGCTDNGKVYGLEAGDTLGGWKQIGVAKAYARHLASLMQEEWTRENQ